MEYEEIIERQKRDAEQLMKWIRDYYKIKQTGRKER